MPICEYGRSRHQPRRPLLFSLGLRVPFKSFAFFFGCNQVMSFYSLPLLRSGEKKSVHGMKLTRDSQDDRPTQLLNVTMRWVGLERPPDSRGLTTVTG